MTLKSELIKLAFDNPELRKDILPLVTASNPLEQAEKLLKDGVNLEKTINRHAQAIAKALAEGAKQLDRLKQYGDGNLSAPNILANEPLDEIKKLHTFLGNVITQIERLKPHGR